MSSLTLELLQLRLGNNAVHAKPGLRVFLEWRITCPGCSGSVIADVIMPNPRFCSAKDAVSEVEKLASVPTGESVTEEVLTEGDFGTPTGSPAYGISANWGQPMVIYGSSCLHEKSPGNIVFPGLLESDADGTRTRNHRIDSPVL